MVRPPYGPVVVPTNTTESLPCPQFRGVPSSCDQKKTMCPSCTSPTHHSPEPGGSNSLLCINPSLARALGPGRDLRPERGGHPAEWGQVYEGTPCCFSTPISHEVSRSDLRTQGSRCSYRLKAGLGLPKPASSCLWPKILVPSTARPPGSCIPAPEGKAWVGAMAHLLPPTPWGPAWGRNSQGQK